ncbi:MAG: AAA family ATPase [Candidatus Thorarchaeota archaeon]
MGEETSLADVLRVVPPEDIKYRGARQHSVVTAAQTFIADLRAASEIGESGTVQMAGRVLVAGPPGTDLPSFPETVCYEIPLKMIPVSTVNVLREPARVAEVMTAVVELARREAPALLFFDRVELFADSGPWSVACLADSVSTIGWTENEVILVGTTNCPERLDPSVLAAFDRAFTFANASDEDRSLLIEEILPSEETTADRGLIMEFTDGWSFSDTKRLVEMLRLSMRTGAEVNRRHLEELVEKHGIIPLGGTGGRKEIVRRTQTPSSETLAKAESLYPDDFLDQLYLMAVSDDYVRTQQVVEHLNDSFPLDSRDIEFLSRYPFLLEGSADRRLARLIRAKRTRDRLMRVMGRER